MLWRQLTIRSGLCCLLLSPLLADAEIYRYQDRDGRTYYTDQPKQGDRFTLIRKFDFGNARKGWTSERMRQRRQELSPLIERLARENALDPKLVHAVIRAESAYDAKALSPKGAAGLMQLMPATAQRYQVEDRYDPEQNIRGGTRYLRDLMQQFDQNLKLVLAAYNAGEHRVVQYDYQIPPFPETRDYVRKVISWYQAGD